MTSNLTMLEKAHLAWSRNPPDWIIELARMATAKGLNACAKRLGYSAGALSQTLGNKYPGDINKIEEKVRGALMNAKVTCPVLGVIGRDRCIASQALPKAFTNSVRTRLYRACRNGCPHSRLKGSHDA